tara:strand:+ start:77 stop:460 length:384 start_codon:yes stop_codon:yes gene_type:complete
MNVKKIITLLALLMLMSSGAANADWGDVYYCQMTNLVGLTLNGKKISYTEEKFQFKLDQTKKSMIFGSVGYLSDIELKLLDGASFPSLEEWYAGRVRTVAYFSEGKFLYSYTGHSGLKAVSADCDKF